LSFPHILPHFVTQILTCSLSYELWRLVVGLNEQNKKKSINHSWRFSAIYELLRWYEYNSPCTKGRAKCSRVRFEEQVGRNFLHAICR